VFNAAISGYWVRDERLRTRIMLALHKLSEDEDLVLNADAAGCVFLKKRAVRFFGWVFSLLSFGPSTRAEGPRGCCIARADEQMGRRNRLGGRSRMIGRLSCVGRYVRNLIPMLVEHAHTPNNVRAQSRPIPPRWRPIRFRLALRTYALWGGRTYVWRA